MLIRPNEMVFGISTFLLDFLPVRLASFERRASINSCMNRGTLFSFQAIKRKLITVLATQVLFFGNRE